MENIVEKYNISGCNCDIDSVLTRMKLTSLTRIERTQNLEKLVSMVTHFWLKYHVKNNKSSKAFYLEW